MPALGRKRKNSAGPSADAVLMSASGQERTITKPRSIRYTKLATLERTARLTPDTPALHSYGRQLSPAGQSADH